VLNLVSGQLIVIHAYHSCFTGCRSLHKKECAETFPIYGGAEQKSFPFPIWEYWAWQNMRAYSGIFACSFRICKTIVHRPGLLLLNSLNITWTPAEFASYALHSIRQPPLLLNSPALPHAQFPSYLSLSIPPGHFHRYILTDSYSGGNLRSLGDLWMEG